MPVTARLSRRFYDAIGDDAANDLVDWMNAVDLTYRTELLQQNEANFTRFVALLDSRFAELEARLEARFAAFEAKMTRLMFIFWTTGLVTLVGTLVALK